MELMSIKYDFGGYTLLVLSVCLDNSEIVRLLINENFNIFKLLIRNKSDVHLNSALYIPLIAVVKDEKPNC